MAVIVFVDNNFGTPGTPWDSWDNSFDDLTTALADASVTAGSTVYIDDGYNASQSGVDFGNNGTTIAPIKVISVDRGSSAGTDSAANSLSGLTYSAGAVDTATVDVTMGATAIVIDGVSFKAADDINGEQDTSVILKNCTLEITGVTANNVMNWAYDDMQLALENVVLKFGAVTQGMQLGGGHQMVWKNVSVDATTVPTGLLYNSASRGIDVHMENCDFTAIATGKSFIDALPTAVSKGQHRFHGYNVFFGTGGTIVNASFVEHHSDFEFYNVGIGTDTVYEWYKENYRGVSVPSINTVYLSGLARDGTTPLSNKIVSTSAATFDNPFRMLLARFDSAANPTVTVHMIHEGVGAGTAGDLMDDEIWIEVHAPDASTRDAGGVEATSKLPRVLVDASDAADLSNNTESWTENLTGEVKQEMAVTVSGGGAGEHHVWICCGAAFTVYVDPVPVLT